MAPIHTAIIGLSTAAKTSWASAAHLPYLLSDRGRERFQIVALLNSSVDSAKKAIADYKLGSDVKAYGSPQDLAADKDVEFVVCATRVDVHYGTIKPSVAAGKDVFVEWPLAENVKRASELAELAKEKQVTTAVGIQARVAPVVLKVKEIIQSGAIGKVLCSEVKVFQPTVERGRVSEGLSYFLDKKVGGNPVSIGYAHMIDFIHSILGEFEHFDSHTQLRRPAQVVYDTQTGAERHTTSDVPDHVAVHGTLKPSTHVAEGASLVVNFRTGAPFPGTKVFVWVIEGDKGEIRVEADKSSFIQMEASNLAMPIEVHDYGTDKVDKVEWKWDDFLGALPARARNIGRLYDLYAEGKLKEYGVADFEAAVVRHREIDRILWP
ncbi:hypothetical protein LTR86_000624 [Recurvomyces mirabilis]|nr:hypothetical protein LTR86_000624 [Recurvomyces mirabilis]